MGNEKKNITLGMNYSTAAGRLRKLIFFSLVERSKENFCFVCRETITKAEDLSIEHKLPWESRSSYLFWDLNNIAFSHLKCNRPHIQGGGLKRKENPEGKIWCAGHKHFLPSDFFYKKVSTITGYQVNCKECHDVKRGRKHFGEIAHSEEH